MSTFLFYVHPSIILCPHILWTQDIFWWTQDIFGHRIVSFSRFSLNFNFGQNGHGEMVYRFIPQTGYRVATTQGNQGKQGKQAIFQEPHGNQGNLMEFGHFFVVLREISWNLISIQINFFLQPWWTKTHFQPFETCELQNFLQPWWMIIILISTTIWYHSIIGQQGRRVG